MINNSIILFLGYYMYIEVFWLFILSKLEKIRTMPKVNHENLTSNQIL